MPFQSEKQRKYLWANEPEIARDWSDKYGNRVKKDTGGITRLPFFQGGYPNFFQMTPEKIAEARNLSWKDAWNLEKKYKYNPKYPGGVGKGKYTLEGLKSLIGMGDPKIGGASPLTRKLALMGSSPGMFNAFTSLGTTGLPLAYTYGASKLQESLPMSLIGQGGLSDQNPYFGAMGVSVNPTVEEILRYGDDGKPSPDTGEGSTLAGIWDAIKSEFGGSAEAADLSDMIPKDLEKTIEEGMKRRPQAGQRRSGIPRRDTWNQYQLTERGPFGGPFGYMGYTNQAFKDKNFAWENLIKGGDYIPGADLNKAHREMMNKKMRSYSEGETIPSEYPYADMIKTAPYMPDKLPLLMEPYKGSRYATTDLKNIGTRVLTKEEYDNFNLDEDDPYVDRIRNRINTVSQPRGILAALRNRFYKPATMHTRDYTPAQLNRMNALGGQYSEPARQQRQDRTRVANLLARKAADKPYSQKNLNILTMGSRPGHYDRPGGGNGVQGTSTPSRSGGWHPGV